MKIILRGFEFKMIEQLDSKQANKIHRFMSFNSHNNVAHIKTHVQF